MEEERAGLPGDILNHHAQMLDRHTIIWRLCT